MADKGLFITFEGIEGSGKSTQAAQLADFLEANSVPYILTREPGGTALGEKIRSLLISPENKDMDDLAEVFLFAAARRQHVCQLIKPSLSDGMTVICDRFADATMAYQGYGRGLNPDDIKHINDLCLWGVKPDITFLIDVDVDLSFERMRRRCAEKGQELDRLERLDRDFFMRVREGYLNLARTYPERFCVLDGSRTPEDIGEEIVKTVFPQLLRRMPHGAYSSVAESITQEFEKKWN